MRFGLYFDTTWDCGFFRRGRIWKHNGYHYATEWGIGPLSFVKYHEFVE